MLGQARVKTITVHTRKEVIAIFEELKNKINAAFQSQSQQSLSSLLAVIKVIYYLAPLPKFLIEINSIGTLPATGFLENLLIKFRMNKAAQDIHFQQWIASLLIQFEKCIATLNLSEVKGLQQIKIGVEEYEWRQQKIKQFISNSLEECTNSNDAGNYSCIIILFRNFLIFSEGTISKLEGESVFDWSQAVKYLTRGCWMLNNITREQSGICINYYLCLKQQWLCCIAMDNGIINYLLQILGSRYIFESFGKRVIEFLRYLTFNASPQHMKQINLGVFEQVLSKFVIKYNKSSMIGEVRSLMSLFDKKIDISHEDRLERIYALFESNKESDEQEIFKHLSIISLYALNHNMADLIIRDHQKFVNFMIASPNQILVKMLAELLSLGFKTGKLGKSVGDAIIAKVNKLVGDEQMKDRFNVYRKRILIEIVRALRELLKNRELYEVISTKMKSVGLQKKLWSFSDCTNYQFEKQMISFGEQLGNQQFHENERSVFYQLQDDFIEKSKSNLNKATAQTLGEIQLLHDLYNKYQHLCDQLAIHPDLSPTLSNYIHPITYSAASALDSLELEEKEHLRKKFNFIICKFLHKLLKNKQEIATEKTKLIELSVSADELDEVRPIIHKILEADRINKDEQLKGKEKMPHQHYEAQVRVKELIKNYFEAEHTQPQFLLDLSESQLEIVINEVQGYENEANLSRLIRLLFQISSSEFLCLQIFLKFGSNLANIYNYMLANASQSKLEGVAILQQLLIRMVKLHVDLYFNDQYMEVNFWLEIVSTIDSFFEILLTNKRIILLGLILEYLDMNKLLNPSDMISMFSKNARYELINAEILLSKGEILGFCVAILLQSKSSLQIENLLFHHKQNVTRLLLVGSELINVPKFVSQCLLFCPEQAFSDFHLEDWVESAIILLQKEINGVEAIVSHAPEAAVKLRRINHLCEILNSLNLRKNFNVKKGLLLAEDEILLNCIRYLAYYVDMFQGEQFKRYYLGEIISTAMVTLVNLYRNNFKYINVKGGDLIQCFDSLLSINTEPIKDAVCQLMHILLLKKQVRMMNCQTLTMCKDYIQSLSPISQQHVYFCQRIEHILYQGGDLEQEVNNYFQDTINNTQQICQQQDKVEIPTKSAYLISEEQPQQQDPHLSKKQSIDLEEPLFLEFASENSIPIDNSLIIEQSEDKIVADKGTEIKSLSLIESASYDQRESNRQKQFQKSTQIIELLDRVWSEQELIEAIQKYVDGNEETQIKTIIDRLMPLLSKRYYALLVHLFLKTKNDYQQNKHPFSKITLHDIHQKIISCIPVELCTLDDNFYEILASGIEGAMLGLKVKNVGLKGLQIYSKKFMNSLNLNDVSFYAELLAEKKTFQELKFLKTCKIYEAVNQKLPYFIKNGQPLTNLCNLITETSKYPPLCNSYEIVPNFCKHLVSKSLDSANRIPILKALKSLCSHSDKHRKLIQNVQFLGELIELLQKSDKQEQGSIAQLLMLGAEQNIEIGQFYQKLSLEQILLAILRKFVDNSDYHYQLFTHSLKILETLAILPQSAIRILKGGMMSLCQPIAELVVKASHFQIIGISINILRNLLEEMELNLSKVIVELEKDGFLSYLLFVGNYLPRCQQIESYLGIFCRLLTNTTINKKVIEKANTVLCIMNDLARSQIVTQILLEQWMKTVFLLVEINRYSILPEILKSNIFFSAASCLRSYHSLSETILNTNNRMMREVNIRAEVKGLLAIHGYADFLVEVLRMSNLPLDEYLKILNTLTQLLKNRYFSSKLCTQLFAVVMVKLQAHWKDAVAITSISLLKNIKRNVEVTSEFGSLMLEFFAKFLTQSSKISSYEYYSISREVICLLSYFLIFNEQIRFLFRNRLVLDILKNWLRIGKALNYVEMPQSFKIFYYSVYCQHSLYVDLCDVNSKKLAEAEGVFERGWKCNLYRTNGTYKEAIMKLDKSKVEIVAFKYPDGIRKDKYRIHLKDLLVVERYQNQKDTLFLESVFTKGLNPFQHKVSPQNCLTLLCLSDHSFEVREISVQMEKKSELEAAYEYAKLLASKWAESRMEEDSKVWQLVNRKL